MPSMTPLLLPKLNAPTAPSLGLAPTYSQMTSPACHRASNSASNGAFTLARPAEPSRSVGMSATSTSSPARLTSASAPAMPGSIPMTWPSCPRLAESERGDDRGQDRRQAKAASKMRGLKFGDGKGSFEGVQPAKVNDFARVAR